MIGEAKERCKVAWREDEILLVTMLIVDSAVTKEQFGVGDLDYTIGRHASVTWLG